MPKSGSSNELYSELLCYWICLILVSFSQTSQTTTEQVEIERVDSNESVSTSTTTINTNISTLTHTTSKSESTFQPTKNQSSQKTIKVSSRITSIRTTKALNEFNATSAKVRNTTGTPAYNASTNITIGRGREGTKARGFTDPYPSPIVASRPDLVHPGFWTYLLMITLPCVVGWCIITLICLWICRPHSPLFREILKRLIEHSQMKQKSVLFSATARGTEQPQEGASTSGLD